MNYVSMIISIVLLISNNYVLLEMTNPSVYTKDISTCTSQTTHEDESHTLSVTGDSHTPSVTDDSHSYLAGIC